MRSLRFSPIRGAHQDWFPRNHARRTPQGQGRVLKLCTACVLLLLLLLLFFALCSIVFSHGSRYRVKREMQQNRTPEQGNLWRERTALHLGPLPPMSISGAANALVKRETPAVDCANRTLTHADAQIEEGGCRSKRRIFLLNIL
jgi:hypothetical protein